MTDSPAWVRDAVFYEIFPDRFAASERVPKPGPLDAWDAPPTYHGFKGGDLLGVVEHLPYLQDLGITAIYLTPIFTSAANHRYHTYDYFSVDPLLGGDAALRELLDEAHARGMRVILDGVFNHTGRGFWPFHHVLENGAESPYRHWFNFDESMLAIQDGRPLAYPPPNTPPELLGYDAWWGLPALPKLNTWNPLVREYLMTVAEHWLRFGIDGWRLDVPEEIGDESFWQEFRWRCRAIRSDCYIVGEIWYVAPEWVRGDRFDAVMDYPMGEAIISFAGGSQLDMESIVGHNEYTASIRPLDGPGFAAALEDVLNGYDPDVMAVQLNFLGSHDTPRLRTVLGDDTTGVRLAMLLMATLPGAPCIYYGDEIGMFGGLDPDCRRAFPWDESRWDEPLRSFIRWLLGVRAAEAALRSEAVVVVAADGGAVAYTRGFDADRLVVAVNASDDWTRLDVRLDGARDGARLIEIGGVGALGGAAGVAAVGVAGSGVAGSAAVGEVAAGSGVSGGVATVELGPRSGFIFRLG